MRCGFPLLHVRRSLRLLLDDSGRVGVLLLVVEQLNGDVGDRTRNDLGPGVAVVGAGDGGEGGLVVKSAEPTSSGRCRSWRAGRPCRRSRRPLWWGRRPHSAASWASLEAGAKVETDQFCAPYSGGLEEIDQHVGQVRGDLERRVRGVGGDGLGAFLGDVGDVQEQVVEVVGVAGPQVDGDIKSEGGGVAGEVERGLRLGGQLAEDLGGQDERSLVLSEAWPPGPKAVKFTPSASLLTT